MISMKNIFLTVIAALFCVSAFCDECLSEPFTFLSVEDMKEPLLLKSTDPIYYSKDLASGEPESVTIKVQDLDNPVWEEVLFTLTAPFEDGTFCWDYYQQEYRNLPAGHTYMLSAWIKSSPVGKYYFHTIKIVPEPAVFLLFGIIGFLFLRKRVRSLVSVIVAFAMIGAFSARAEGVVGEVTAQQLFPFERTVVVNYTLESDENDEFTVDFFCTPDNGSTFYKLSEYGTLSGEGTEGTVSGNGKHKTYWTPGPDFDEIGSESMMVKVVAEVVPPPPKTFMTIDLTDGSVSYSPEEPTGGWTEEYKTTKLALKRIEAGTFYMGTPTDAVSPHRDSKDCVKHEVTLTKAFYVGVFEVTQKQYQLITGTDPSNFKGDNRPVEGISYNTITGEGGFFALLNERTGLTFGLPTEAQWEYACRAGTDTDLNDGENLTNGGTEDLKMNEVGRYGYNKNFPQGGYQYYEHTVVGLYRPNGWGLYDMHGNVCEYCRDFISPYNGTEPVTDQVGQTSSNYLTVRGGFFSSNPIDCRSASRSFQTKVSTANSRGFRVFMQIEE
jgi:formylglycine-generating enzyme required for sulfatase activity